mmetsp:Transcript_17916/g.30474  ORF Transcript_17916/g.30474 Transcript_17916/m.30474 type:complete len:88 (-) Transcript_17916:54-317(-)
MKSKYYDEKAGGLRHGRVYLGTPQKSPDVVIKTDATTFDRLTRKEVSGTRAYLSGKLSYDGSLMKLRKYESNVINKFVMAELEGKVC